MDIGKLAGFKRTYNKLWRVEEKLRPSELMEMFWTFFGGFIGIACIGLLQSYFHDFSPSGQLFLIGSFGASAVLVYGSPKSPLAQPRNLILGHLTSAFIGVTVYKFVGEYEVIWLSCGLAVGMAIIGMQLTKSLHPPGGATALIAVIGTEKVKTLGYYYLLSPVFSGVLILFIVGIIINNIPKNRQYPLGKNKK
ncbi:HPP family protein [Echinicola jeungdonensis]|uniref:HPP family protein n=1 Tax=Echinicola jeungdonensis TaxID=709343 RepID=A0ABV5J0Y7_9BACT|nr:HPP family protein [Echinicola jeungdonensis]MDN3668322.1 HPP family protein [Echinicola jeungdonensis]